MLLVSDDRLRIDSMDRAVARGRTGPLTGENEARLVEDEVSAVNLIERHFSERFELSREI